MKIRHALHYTFDTIIPNILGWVGALAALGVFVCLVNSLLNK